MWGRCVPPTSHRSQRVVCRPATRRRSHPPRSTHPPGCVRRLSRSPTQRPATSMDIFRNNDRFVLRRSRFKTRIYDVCACCLGEDGRCLAHQTEVRGTHVEGFEELRSGLKLRPCHRPSERREFALKNAALLQEDEISGSFLQSNAECLAVGLRSWSQAADAEYEPRCQHLKIATIDHGEVPYEIFIDGTRLPARHYRALELGQDEFLHLGRLVTFHQRFDPWLVLVGRTDRNEIDVRPFRIFAKDRILDGIQPGLC